METTQRCLKHHRLAETAAARHAAHFALRKQRFVHYGYQSALVHILTVADLAEALITFIDIQSHVTNYRILWIDTAKLQTNSVIFKFWDCKFKVVAHFRPHRAADLAVCQARRCVQRHHDQLP